MRWLWISMLALGAAYAASLKEEAQADYMAAKYVDAAAKFSQYASQGDKSQKIDGLYWEAMSRFQAVEQGDELLSRADSTCQALLMTASSDDSLFFAGQLLSSYMALKKDPKLALKRFEASSKKVQKNQKARYLWVGYLVNVKNRNLDRAQLFKSQLLKEYPDSPEASNVRTVDPDAQTAEVKVKPKVAPKRGQTVELNISSAASSSSVVSQVIVPAESGVAAVSVRPKIVPPKLDDEPVSALSVSSSSANVVVVVPDEGVAAVRDPAAEKAALLQAQKQEKIDREAQARADREQALASKLAAKAAAAAAAKEAREAKAQAAAEAKAARVAQLQAEREAKLAAQAEKAAKAKEAKASKADEPKTKAQKLAEAKAKEEKLAAEKAKKEKLEAEKLAKAKKADKTAKAEKSAKSKDEPAAKGSYFLQLGSFKSKESADTYLKSIQGKTKVNGLKVVDHGGVYKVRLFGFDDRESAADFAAKKIKPKGFDALVVQSQNP